MQIHFNGAAGLDITGFIRGRAHPYKKDHVLGKDEVTGSIPVSSYTFSL